MGESLGKQVRLARGWIERINWAGGLGRNLGFPESGSEGQLSERLGQQDRFARGCIRRIK